MTNRTTATLSRGRAAAAEPASEPPLAVRTQRLRKCFGDRTVLDELDLQLVRGEFVALLGRSGSGKSTLLRALAGIDDNVDGVIGVAKQRAVVFQEPRLLPWRRVMANVALGLPNISQSRARVWEALTEVGLAGHERSWPRTLSGGEAQRAALARALVREPELLLLDEPFGALDALTRINMHTLLREVYQRHRPAVLLVTHDVDEALSLAGRVLVLSRGHISLDTGALDPHARSDPEQRVVRQRLFGELGVVVDAPEVDTSAV